MKKHAGSGKIMLIRLDPDLQHCLPIPWVLSFCDWLRKCIRILFVLSNWCAWLSQMAQQHAKMDLFADIVGDDASPEDYHRYCIRWRQSWGLPHVLYAVTPVLRTTTGTVCDDASPENYWYHMYLLYAMTHVLRAILVIAVVGDDASPEDYLSSYNEQYWALKNCCMLLTQIKYVLVCQHCCLLRGWEEQPPGGPVLLPGRRVLQGGHATTTVTFGTLVLGIQYIWIRILRFALIWIQFRVWILAVSHVYF